MSKLFLHPVSFKSTSDSTSSSDSTAAVSVKGGLSVLKNGNFGGKLSAVGFSAGNGVISNVATPILSTDACNKAYVDIYTSTFTSPPPPTDFSLEIDSGDLRISSNALSTGLLGGSGTAISVNPVQTLTQLTCSTVSITTSLGMNSKKIQNLAKPLSILH